MARDYNKAGCAGAGKGLLPGAGEVEEKDQRDLCIAEHIEHDLVQRDVEPLPLAPTVLGGLPERSEVRPGVDLARRQERTPAGRFKLRLLRKAGRRGGTIVIGFAFEGAIWCQRSAADFAASNFLRSWGRRAAGFGKFMK